MKKRTFLKTCFIALSALLIPRRAKALDFYPTAGKTEWAILFGTWCGTARDAGVWISEGMNGIADVFDVRENPDLSAYKYIVAGGAIRGGAVSKELQEYLSKHQPAIKDKIKGLFAICGNMQQPVTHEQYIVLIDNHLAKLTGVEKVPSKIFLGRITWGLMDPEIQKQMRSFPGLTEYDNLKRSECMDFGREILQSV